MATASVILPACNEEEGLQAVLKSLRDVPLELEIIVVDDGSTDRTEAIALSHGITVVRHALTLGAGQSVKDGVAHASSEKIIMMDADCTYPAERIPDFLQMLDKGYDLVVGARHGKEYWGSPLKMIARFIFRLIAEFATGKHIPDINSGMRAFRKADITPYFPRLCNGFSLPTTMTLAYFFTGKKVAYLPIDYHKRMGKSKVRIITDSLRTLQYITESVIYYNPIKFFLFIALIVFGIAVAAGFGMQSGFIFFNGFYSAALIFALGLVAQSMKR